MTETPAQGGEVVPVATGAVTPAGQAKSSVEPYDPAQFEDMLAYLQQMTRYWDRLLPQWIDRDQFISATFATLYDSKTLKSIANANQHSLIHSLMMSAHFGLVPDGVQAALVPYKNSITFQPMYQGLIDLMHFGGVVKVEFDRIYEGDTYKVRRGALPPDDFWHEPDITINPFDDERRCLAAYAFAWLPDGVRSQVVTMSPEEALHIAATYSQSYQSAEKKRRDYATDFAKNPWKDDYHSPWHDNFPALHMKTVVKRLAKRVRTSPLLNQLIMVDNTTDSVVTAKTVTPPEVFQAVREISQGTEPEKEQKPERNARHRFVYQDDSDACGFDGCRAPEDDEGAHILG